MSSMPDKNDDGRNDRGQTGGFPSKIVTESNFCVDDKA